MYHDGRVSEVNGMVTTIGAVPPATERRIGHIRVVIVNNLLEKPEDLSDVARSLPQFDEEAWVKRDRDIATLALANIEQNVRNLAETSEVKVLHVSEVTEDAVREFEADAVVLSGSLRDFDFYDPAMLERFGEWVRRTSVPVLGICGGHQLVGMVFGARVVTLDHHEPSERRDGRIHEYQYRFVKIVRDDPIFEGIVDAEDSHHTKRRRAGILRVWQNHGLQIDRLPEGFVNLAAGYLCPLQMMVKRDECQLIYTVQFHIEKSFEDWQRPKSFWDHHVESRDGRVIFENFLLEALAFNKAPRPSTCSA